MKVFKTLLHHGDIAPEFELHIIAGNLNLSAIWYSIDGKILIFCGKSGHINHDLWNALPPGSHNLTFHVRDIFGHEGFSWVIIIKKEGQAIYGYDYIIISLMVMIGIIGIAWQIRKRPE